MTVQPTRRFGLVPMLPRDPAEPHRTASPLELLFDLVFVVAVSVSSAALFDVESEGHLAEAALGYLSVFFAIWWAWMGFTWFATSFDTDDWLYRVTTIIQMAGALVIAAGAKSGVLEHDFSLVVLGYVIMRVASISQWVRAGRTNPEFRGTTTWYAMGTGVLQVFWVLILVIPDSWVRPWFVTLVVLELLVPVMAKRQRPTPWHPHHVTERFGLFTIILLGESLLASSNAIFVAVDGGDDPLPFISIAALSLVVIAAMWWLYFARSMADWITTPQLALAFGYFHYVVFASAGAFSAGVEVAVAVEEGHIHLGDVMARATLAVPVSLFVLSVWWLALRPALSSARNRAVAALGCVIAASVFVPFSLIVVAGAAAAIVVIVHTSPAAPVDSVAHVEIG
jgi:low temperature requirement protein LtrA